MAGCSHDEKHFTPGVGCSVCMLQRRMVERARPIATAPIVYRATVRGVSTVDVTLELHPTSDNEQGLSVDQDRLQAYIPEAANGKNIGDILRAYGAWIEVAGAVRITIELDPQ